MYCFRHSNQNVISSTGKDKHIKKRYTKPRQDSEVVLSLQDIISSETENAYFEKNVLDTAVNVNPQKTYDTGE